MTLPSRGGARFPFVDLVAAKRAAAWTEYRSEADVHLTIKTGWQGADQAIQISEAVLPNETAGRFYVAERKPFVRLVTAWEGDQVVGYLIVEFDDTTEYLREVGVREEYQGQGIGRALVHAYATATEMQDLWCRPLPHRREIFIRWGFTREEDGDLWGAKPKVVQKTAPRNSSA